MAEETVPVPVEDEKMEETAAPSTSAEPVEGGEDVDNEAKKLMGAGRRHLVMKDIRAAVNAFQEACSLLGKKYGETADECADAFFSYGMALLELARMENGVLGNALEGMPEDEEEDGEKEEDPNIPSAANLDEKEREQLREQVYDAMAEKEKPEKSDAEEPKTEGKAENGDVHMEEGEKSSEDKGAEEKTNGDVPASDSEKVDEAEKSTAVTEEKGEVEKSADESKGEEMEATEKAKEKTEDSSEPPAQEAGSSKPSADSEAPSQESEEAKPAEETKGAKPPSEEPASKEQSEKDAKPSSEETAAKEQPDEMDTKPPSEETASKEQPEKDAKPSSEETASKEQPDGKDAKAEGEAEAEPMEGEEEGEGADSEDGEENEGTEEKENDEEEVGNLQLAWEMLDLSKVIFKRQQTKEAQLKAAQAHLKLGEVSIESENYSQAIEDFLACLNIQKEHLEEHDRLLAETHYQLGLAYQYSSKHDSAISHFTQSTEVIEKRVAMITEQMEKAAGESTEELQKEMDELKGLLPDIREKIEDSKEAQKTSEATEKALKETLAGGSSGFSQENGSTSSAPTAPAEKTGDSTVPVTNCVSDISHLVRKKRKPEEESPLKEAKKSKAEPVENGSGNGDAVVPTNEAEKAEEAEKQTPVETPMETTAVESTA